MNILEVKNLNFSYEDTPILSDINFSLKKSEILCILGPSGCGKTTLLQCLSGFEAIEEGEIIYNSKVVSSKNDLVSPEKRKMGLVFQDYALFPHMNVKENILFALRKESKEVKEETLSRVLELVGLKNKCKSYPHELSGGEQQRVAIARSLATGSELILFDEPFSNLDPGLRKKLRIELREILKRTGVSAIFITHDQNEAYDIADRIAVLGNKKIEQIGEPYELYQNPNNTFVANFLGSQNLIKADYNQETQSYECPLFSIKSPEIKGSFEDFYFYLPSDAIETEVCDLQGHQFKINSKQFRGDHYHLQVESKDIKINLSRPTRSLNLFNNGEVCLYFDLDKVTIIGG
jgi:ABC-type Fe3+/spermidine/putrescine transport system ATPase subunit